MTSTGDGKGQEGKADIGVIGLAVMGENLILNFESRGFTVAVHNRTTTKIDEFIGGRGSGKKLIGCHTLTSFAAALAKPRKVMLMVMAGAVVDAYIEKLIPVLEDGDIIIDGGNSNFEDTNRRTIALRERKNEQKKQIWFVGTGVSGGEEGALHGPSIMPGGAPEAWAHVRPMLQAISAKVGVNNDIPCCDWVGDGGAGHFVKTVHNGIEYGDMQLICEAYHLLKSVIGMTNDELSAEFKAWNTGDLASYLIEITSEIFAKRDEEKKDKHVVDLILDKAGQKGTGKWTAISALDLGMPLTLIGEAVFARCLSAQIDQRHAASQVLRGPQPEDFKGNKREFINAVKDALYASKLVSYAQGFVLIRAASLEYKWNIDYGAVALMWRGGCIIRSNFLGNIKEAFDRNKNLDNLLLDEFFLKKMGDAQRGWREVASLAVSSGVPIPAMSSALAYYDGYRTARLPANLLQAQRDYFGAHTYERTDQSRGRFFHTNWTGRGGTTASTVYNVGGGH